MCKGKYSQLTITDYSDYYNQLFGGFDECNSSDDESLSEEDKKTFHKQRNKAKKSFYAKREKGLLKG